MRVCNEGHHSVRRGWHTVLLLLLLLVLLLLLLVAPHALGC
jgi:hypothetical protein